MADNVTLNAGSGGAVIATDEDGTPAHHQYVKVEFGADGTFTKVTSSVGLPVGDAGGSLTVDNGGTFLVQENGAALTALQLIDDAVYAEDVAASIADKGISVLAVRRDTASTMVSADNDYTNLIVDSSGRLHVNVGNTVTVTGAGGTFPVTDSGGSLTVDAPVGTPVFVRLSDGSSAIATLPVNNGGTFAVQVDGSALTALQLLDDVVYAEDVAAQVADKGVAILAVRRDADTSLVGADNDYANLQVDANGYLKVEVFDGGGSHTVDNNGTFLVQENGAALTALQLIDDAIFAEDVAAQAADKGIQILTVRKDTAAATSGTDGDYQPPVSNARGATWVAIEDGAGGQITSFGGGTQYTEDAAAAANPVGTALMLVREDARGGSLTTADGDNVAARGTNAGELYVKHVDAIPATQSGTWNITNVSGTVSLPTGAASATNQDTIIGHLDGVEGLLTTIDADTGSMLTALQLIDDVVFAEDAAHTTADKGIQVLAVRRDSAAVGSGTDGDYSTLNVDANGRLYVGCDTHAVTQSGTWNVGTVTTVTGVTTVTTVTTCSTVTTLANGQTAHDSAVSGSPLRVGAKAETALSGITLVADGDATDLHAGVDGVLITRPHCNLEDVVQERTTNTDGASTAFASGLAAPGSGVRLWIKNVTICNSSASFCTVDLRDGSGGSVLWTLPVPATGGVTHNFDPPLKLTANTALAFDASAATTTLTISVNGFKSKV